ncbi:hypothetical protein RRG08_022632 [Elysia crispata]|uniref:Uncharacterized protein n=1 Tax=Elysia crispata TaxID=231223 RepID=A0AAE0Z3K3_9GAST|nr:hypothetical protein RRG08_022632 [Elysia crispata]
MIIFPQSSTDKVCLADGQTQPEKKEKLTVGEAQRETIRNLAILLWDDFRRPGLPYNNGRFSRSLELPSQVVKLSDSSGQEASVRATDLRRKTPKHGVS